jgi:hypothetical protein
MATDPSEQRAQTERSTALLDEQREQLAVEAAELALAHPGQQWAGLVLDGDAPEAGLFRARLEELTGQDLGAWGFAGIVPRELVVELVRAHCPALLDWLPAAGHGPRRRLPILVVGADGFRAAGVEYEVGG